MITVLQAYLKSKILECQCWPLAWEVLATPDTKVTFKNLFKYIAFTHILAFATPFFSGICRF